MLSHLVVVMYGDYLDFLKKWYPHRDSPNNIYLYYEDMKNVRSGKPVDQKCENENVCLEKTHNTWYMHRSTNLCSHTDIIIFNSATVFPAERDCSIW